MRRALMKLTLGYMLLIMVVSGILSFALYRGSAVPLERRLELEQEVLEPPPFPMERPRQLDPGAVAEVKHRVAILLVYFNLAVLCLAGIVSYGLARRELKPMQEAFELQSRFTSDAAHELRTPLTAMRTEIEVALRAGELRPEEARELLESNLEEISKLESLSSGLLKLAQYEEGPVRFIGTVSIADILHDSVGRVRRAADSRGISIAVDAGDGEVPGDFTTLVEMLVVVLDNAVKYSDDGTEISVTATRVGRNAVIEVKDQGYGISSEDLPHVFDRLYRGSLPAEKKQVEGYGLGLPIARRIAEMHRGSIDIASFPGFGTMVTIKLPLAREKTPA